MVRVASGCHVSADVGQVQVCRGAQDLELVLVPPDSRPDLVVRVERVVAIFVVARPVDDGFQALVPELEIVEDLLDCEDLEIRTELWVVLAVADLDVDDLPAVLDSDAHDGEHAIRRQRDLTLAVEVVDALLIEPGIALLQVHPEDGTTTI